VRWFVDITSWEPIAMDLRQLVRAFDGGRIDADTLVWRKGMPDWRRLRDVPELAERLMGAEAAAKAAEAPLETGAGESDPPPPLHVERSRTPPANYSVDDRANGAAAGDARFSSPPAERVVLSAVAPTSEAAATLPGISTVPQTPAGGYTSPTPPRTRARPERRSAQSAGSSLGSSSLFGSPQTGSTQVGLSAAGPAPATAETRTITQTGLAPAAEPAPRTSATPTGAVATAIASEARAAEPEAEAARASVTGAQRNSRNPTPAPSPRRVPSSDETPAQKPSSISVPSGQLAPSPMRPRGKHLVAIAVLLLGVALMVRGTLSTESVATAPGSASEHRPMPPVQLANPARVEDRNALAPEPPPEAPKAAAPATPRSVPAPTVTQPASVRESAGLDAAPVANGQQRNARTVPPSTPSLVAPHTVKPAPIPSPAPSTSAPVLDVRPSQPEAVVAAASEPMPATGRGELAAPPAAPSPPEPAPPPVAAAPVPGQSPPSAAPMPGAFDEKGAREQMGIAAFKASTCGQLGETRGVGQVSVLIEHWGRVVRVTHLNQAFVGTPVGLCIMQAFQQVQVSPFKGGAQTLTGSFAVQ
jgi:hypothetical protein